MIITYKNVYQVHMMKTPGRGCCTQLMHSSQCINSPTEAHISSYKLQPFVFRLIIKRKKNNPVHSCALPPTPPAAGKQTAKVAGRRRHKKSCCNCGQGGRESHLWRQVGGVGRAVTLQQKSKKKRNSAFSSQRDGKKMKVVVGLPQRGEEQGTLGVRRGTAWCVSSVCACLGWGGGGLFMTAL